jgi:diguanylate cyclase (GGDEF)-like protein
MLSIRLSVLPLIGLAILGISVALFLLVYWNSYWKLQAKAFIRVLFLVSIANVFQSLLMSTHTGIEARFVYSVALPTVFLEQISVIEVFIVIFNLRKPRWFSGLWAIGTLFLVVSILFHQNIYPVLRQVPDGYFFASPSNDVGFTLLKTIVYNSCLITLICVVIRGLRKQKHRKRWLYALSVGLYGVCLFNDSVILQLHRTLYPTAWVAELIFLGMLWREIHWHMQEVYDRLNRDALTGAFSRSFGELYLSQVLTKQNVGVFYADIDGFKETNDTYGHHVGDEVLQRLVKLVEPLMVMPNVLIRLGGDEFLFVFPNVGSTDESILKHKLQSLLLDGHLMPIGADKEAQVTPSLKVSLGWAYGTSGTSWMSVIHQADLAMYQQKKSNKL